MDGATTAIVLYIVLFLLPIHGLLFIGVRNERIRTRKILMSYWKLHSRRIK